MEPSLLVAIVGAGRDETQMVARLVDAVAAVAPACFVVPMDGPAGEERAASLRERTRLTVDVAAPGAPLAAGSVFLVPAGGRELTLGDGRFASVAPAPAEPSRDGGLVRLLHAIAAEAGPRAVVVLLGDGLRPGSLARVHEAGVRVLAAGPYGAGSGAVVETLPAAAVPRRLAEQARRMPAAQSQKPHWVREESQILLDAMRTPLLLLDSGLRILTANSAFCETFHADADFLLGRHIGEIEGDGWSLPELGALLAQIGAGHRQLGDYRLEHDFGTGTVQNVQIEARRLGRDGRVLLAAEDVTRDHWQGDRGDRGQRLVDPSSELAQRRNDFLGVLGHELRTPLSAIHNVSRLLEGRQGKDPRRREELFRVLTRQARHMVRLVDDLLDYSRANAGVLNVERQRISLRECVVSAVSAIETTAQNNAITLTVDLPREDLWVDADPVRITQVLGNLLDNAVKYTPSGGGVHVSLGVEAGEAVIRVRDTGMGIAGEELDGIFDEFSRVARRGRGQAGLGLGLALVQQLVAIHGGRVEASSAGPERGAELAVRLPLAPDGQRDAGAEAATPRRPGRRVLLVDDNADSVDTLAALLEEEGHEVRAVYSGRAALEIAGGFAPDVVLLDIGMPEMDGIEVAHRLRRDDPQRRMRIVALTGYGEERDLETGDFDQHVLKPVGAQGLEAAIYGDRDGC